MKDIKQVIPKAQGRCHGNRQRANFGSALRSIFFGNGFWKVAFATCFCWSAPQADLATRGNEKSEFVAQNGSTGPTSMFSWPASWLKNVGGFYHMPSPPPPTTKSKSASNCLTFLAACEKQYWPWLGLLYKGQAQEEAAPNVHTLTAVAPPHTPWHTTSMPWARMAALLCVKVHVKPWPNKGSSLRFFVEACWTRAEGSGATCTSGH